MKCRTIAALALSAALLLPLGGCASTEEDQAGKVNSALEHAASEATAKGDKQESLALLERMYKRDAGNADTALRYATALQDAGRSNRSLMVLTPFVQGGKADNNAPLLVEYASVEASIGSYDLAADSARKATASEPKNGLAWHILGIALDAKGSHPEAEDAFRKALQNWQGDPSPVLNNLGLNLAAQGFIDEAVDTLKKAVALAPGRPEIERNLRIVLALQAQPGTHENKRVPPPPHKPEKLAKLQTSPGKAGNDKTVKAEKTEDKPAKLSADDKAIIIPKTDNGTNAAAPAAGKARTPASAASTDETAAPVVRTPNGPNG